MSGNTVVNSRTWYLKNRETYCAALRVKREENRAHAIAYLGGKCVDCGYDANPDGLEFDHLPETPKSFQDGIRFGYTWAAVKKEVDKCELVCGTCHNIRTAKRRRDG